jgi:RNA polymerase sigma factor (sigma-70 family)
MTMTIRQDALTETFEDVKKLIHQACHSFQKKYGGNYEDLFSQAQEVFLEAYDRFDSTKGMTFSTYIRQVIWWRLQDEQRHQAQRNTKLPRDSSDVTDCQKVVSSPVFDLGDFCEITGMSPDAMKVVRLVVTRKEVPGMIRSGKKALRNILTKEFKWSEGRIKVSFKEITTALKEAVA